jgi:hypothetical protein
VWYCSVFGFDYPSSPSQVLDYMEVRALEPCGTTALITYMSSLSFREKVGGVSHEGPQHAVGYWQFNYPAQGVSLELTVMDESTPLYTHCLGQVCQDLGSTPGL